MKKTIIDVQTGKQITVDMTVEEISADLDQQHTIQTELEAYVPSKVPMWAIRTVLENANLIEQSQKFIITSNNIIFKNIWEYGNFIERTSSIINYLKDALKLSDEQIDQIFRDADNLSAV